jgi:hypothetical protein
VPSVGRDDRRAEHRKSEESARKWPSARRRRRFVPAFAGFSALLAGLGAQAQGLTQSRPDRPLIEAQLTEFCQFTGNPGPCGPNDQYQNAIGQDLRMTLVLGPGGKTSTEPPAAATPGPLPAKLDTIRDVFAALRNCFAGGLTANSPVAAETKDLSATIRFSFARNGTIFGEPRFTYIQPGIPAETARGFEASIRHVLGSCVPFPFSKGLGGALAGRPIIIRIVKQA